jgi:hypothetical protein
MESSSSSARGIRMSWVIVCENGTTKRCVDVIEVLELVEVNLVVPRPPIRGKMEAFPEDAAVKSADAG